MVRLLGSPKDLCSGFERFRATGKPMVVVGGEQTPDAALMEMSTVPIGVAAQAHVYLAQGGAENLAQLHGFLSDTVLLTGVGFEPPAEQPVWGELPRPEPAAGDRRTAARGDPVLPGPAGRREHRVRGGAGRRDRRGGRGRAADLRHLAAGGTGGSARAPGHARRPDHHRARRRRHPTGHRRGGEQDEGWDVRALAALDIPILQGLCLTGDRAWWAGSDEGMSPLDVATQVAVPEFDGRIITVPFSFKELDADGLPHYVPIPSAAGGSRRSPSTTPGCGTWRRRERKVAILLSAYPTKHSRIGNAVGLDTPVSLIRLLRAMREQGYDLGEPGEIPGTGALTRGRGRAPRHHCRERLDPRPDRRRWAGPGVVDLGAAVRAADADPGSDLSTVVGRSARRPGAAVTDAWGEAPGELFVDRTRDPEGEIVAAALRAGNLVIVVQPPRGFGENPIAIYHDPDLAPTHHYLATYRWLEREFGAHAVVHVGKHGNLEWLPGKTLGMSASCGTDAAIGSMPLIYPFLVNDPGEGTQAKRRAHATIIDHLVPPMARAESYGDIARLEQLLDEYGNVAVMDPAKAPALQGEIWTLIQSAQLHLDLGLEDRPDDDDLRRVRDARGRLAVRDQGRADPRRAARARPDPRRRRPGEPGAGHPAVQPGVRRSGQRRARVARSRSVSVSRSPTPSGPMRWRRRPAPWSRAGGRGLGGRGGRRRDHGRARRPNPGVAASLRFACTEVVPRLRRTGDEITAVLHALDGGYIPAGPSGSPCGAW